MVLNLDVGWVLWIDNSCVGEDGKMLLRNSGWEHKYTNIHIQKFRTFPALTSSWSPSGHQLSSCLFLCTLPFPCILAPPIKIPEVAPERISMGHCWALDQMANTLPDLDLVPDPYPDLTRPNTLPDLDLLPDLLPWYRRKPCRPISKPHALRAHNQDED